MCNEDILVKLNHKNDSPWASPLFCQLKKMNDIRFLTDFREIKNNGIATENRNIHNMCYGYQLITRILSTGKKNV